MVLAVSKRRGEIGFMREDIETVIDRLLDFVRTNGRVRLQSAASALALSPQQAEKIALLLEESSLLEVEYTLGGIYLSPVKNNVDGDGIPGHSADSPRPPASPATEGESAAEVARLEREVLASENLLKFFERDIERRILVVDALLDNLEKRDDFSEEELSRAVHEIKLASDQLNGFGLEIGKLTASEKRLAQRLEHYAARLAKLTPRSVHASRPPASSRSLSPALDRLRARIRAALAAILAAVRHALSRKGVVITSRDAPPTPLFATPSPVQRKIPQMHREKRLLPPLAIARRNHSRHAHARLLPHSKKPLQLQSQSAVSRKVPIRVLSPPPQPPSAGETHRKKLPWEKLLPPREITPVRTSEISKRIRPAPPFRRVPAAHITKKAHPQARAPKDSTPERRKPGRAFRPLATTKLLHTILFRRPVRGRKMKAPARGSRK